MLAGRHGTLYGITGLYRADPRPFRQDLSTLFGMLERGEIHPLIAARLPLLEARQGIAMLEAGGIEGKIVLAAALKSEAAYMVGVRDGSRTRGLEKASPCAGGLS